MASTITKFAHIKIPLEDVLKATNNLHHDNIIRHGGFGTAYKGRLLRSGKLIKIIAQCFDCKHGEGDLQFLMKISVLSNLKHKNLASIIGFCDGKDEKIIVTKYEAYGSLGQYLDSPNLTWTRRLRICVGLARALSYLHYNERRDYAIIHCDINSDIVLLDENQETKLSGFEISIKQLVSYKDQVDLCEHTGKIGCMDPAMENTGEVTDKSDIYSFGVVLFELLCGRKAFIQNGDDRSFLAPLAKHHYERKTLYDIIDSDICSQMSPQSLFVYSNVAYSCLNEDRAHRPDIKSIVGQLEKALELQVRRKFIGNNLEHLKKIPLSDIKLATDDFSDTYKINVGAYYTLYRARLDSLVKENPSYVVIKRIIQRDDKGGEEVFYTEIEMLTSVKHQRIVTLLGFCVEGTEMILVIENVSNGYLSDYLDDDMSILTWEKRLNICIDIAHAVNYFQSQMEGQNMIINRDINSKHIGLDENWRAKIVEFGFSLLLPANQENNTLYNNVISGTNFYIDPEYERTGKLTRESDVYSFGVVLFEILCGRKAYDPIYMKENDKGLAFVARRSFCTGTLKEMIDPKMKEEAVENNFLLSRGPNAESLYTFIGIAFWCVAETQDQRPTMKIVVKELEKALFLQGMWQRSR